VQFSISPTICYCAPAPGPRVGALSDDARLTSVWRLSDLCLSHSSGLKSRTERPRRPKLAQR